MKHLLFTLIVMGLVFIAGCGHGASVKGKVTFSDGTPLTVGEVVFQTDSRMASGRIQSNGTYQLSGATESEGIPAGHYRVKIVGAYDTSNTPPGTMPGDAKPPIPLIDAKYEKTETSGLVCDVKGTTVFDITVTKP